MRSAEAGAVPEILAYRRPCAASHTVVPACGQRAYTMGETSSGSRVHDYVLICPRPRRLLFGFLRTEVYMAAISSGTASVPESGTDWPAPLDRMLKKELAGLDDRALLGNVRLLPQASERWVAACELLVTRHQRLVWFCGPALAPQPPTGRASATNAHRLYGGRRAWSCVSFAIS
jgi:hypothetical protein